MRPQKKPGDFRPISTYYFLYNNPKRCWTKLVSMLSHRLRRWPNIKTTLGLHHAFFRGGGGGLWMIDNFSHGSGLECPGDVYYWRKSCWDTKVICTCTILFLSTLNTRSWTSESWSVTSINQISKPLTPQYDFYPLTGSTTSCGRN